MIDYFLHDISLFDILSLSTETLQPTAVARGAGSRHLLAWILGLAPQAIRCRPLRGLDESAILVVLINVNSAVQPPQKPFRSQS